MMEESGLTMMVMLVSSRAEMRAARERPTNTGRRKSVMERKLDFIVC